MNGGFLQFLDKIVEIGEFLLMFGNHLDWVKLLFFYYSQTYLSKNVGGITMKG